MRVQVVVVGVVVVAGVAGGKVDEIDAMPVRRRGEER